MSKCREEFEKLAKANWKPNDLDCLLWKAAWNARGKVDAGICRSKDVINSEAFAQAIEQENEK